jgi:hypothetical protein
MEGDSVYVGEADGGVTRIPASEVRSVETRHLHRAVPWVVGGLLFIGFAAVSVVTSFWDS